MTITFAAAKKLFDEKKYQQALQAYEELGKLYGQNVVEYNIQLCEKQLNEILKKHNTGLEAPAKENDGIFLKQINAYKEQDLLDKLFYTITTEYQRNKKDPKISKLLEKEIEETIKKIVLKSKNAFSEGDIQELFVGDHSPLTYVQDVKGLQYEEWPVLISLTTISARVSNLYRTIESLINQKFKPHSINIYLSETPFLIDKGIKRTDSILRDLHEKYKVNIYLVPNIGPYRKQIPILMQLRQINASPESPFITVDDDVIYPNGIISDLRAMNLKTGGCVAHRGRMMNFDINGNLLEYSKFSIPSNKTPLMNIGTGKNGICYLLKFFSKNNLQIAPILIPTTDDIWCKWVTGFKCIPTYILEPKAAYDVLLDFEDTNKEKIGLFHSYNARGANDIAISNMETFCLKTLGYNIQTIYGN